MLELSHEGLNFFSSKTYIFLNILKSPSFDFRIYLYVLYIFEKPPCDVRKIYCLVFKLITCLDPTGLARKIEFDMFGMQDAEYF